MIRRIVLACCVGSLALTAAACNTVRGAGEDLNSAADTVDDAV